MARESLKNLWVMPMLILGSVAFVVTAGLYTLDHYLLGTGGTPYSHYLRFSPEAVSNSIGVLSSIIAAVLGIILTVISIVVQLSATRYTPAVTEMFFRDRTNMIVMALYVVACVMGFWIAFGVNDEWVPRISLLAMLTVATFGFLLMAPYFAYVFRLLSPHTIVQRIESSARRAAIGEDGDEVPRGETEKRQGLLLAMSEQLTDIAVNSVMQKDKIIAIACVDALRDLSTSYLRRKKDLDKDWFEVTRTIKHNPDFGSMAVDSVKDLEQARTWVEFKILRQYQSIYTEALGSMRDLNYVVAINTRLIAEQALKTENLEALALAVKFFNTYLRATLNDNDVRTAYTILNQYRLVAEAVLRADHGELALSIVSHLKYYAHLSYDKRLGFVTETVAYDVAAICEVAHEIESSVEFGLLKILLEVDPMTSEGDVQETSLRGVRKAQLKLATYYLDAGADALAKRVWDDMRGEDVSRMRSIRDELLAVESKDFWEISDRGGNFDYLEPSRKDQLKVFFSWFREVSGAMKTIDLESAPTEGSKP